MDDTTHAPNDQCERTPCSARFVDIDRSHLPDTPTRAPLSPIARQEPGFAPGSSPAETGHCGVVAGVGVYPLSTPSPPKAVILDASFEGAYHTLIYHPESMSRPEASNSCRETLWTRPLADRPRDIHVTSSPDGAGIQRVGSTMKSDSPYKGTANRISPLFANTRSGNPADVKRDPGAFPPNTPTSRRLTHSCYTSRLLVWPH
jgi:hypothetical protein